jgi:glyoxylase-like metal-dependent hydrolase (beta-lactamase superfamily II)
VAELHGHGVTVVSRWVFNCYVIHDGGAGRPVVVDPGLPSTARIVTELLESRGAAPAVVVATHGHADHVGGLLELGAGVDQLALPVRIRDYLHGETPRSPSLAQVASITPVLRDQPFTPGPIVELARTRRHLGVDGRGARLPVRVDQWLVDGETVSGAPDWRVVHTPGHTDDSTSLWNARTGVLVSGDAVLSVGGRAWFTPELVDEDLADRTEDRLRPLPVRALLPGHGRPIVADDVMRRAQRRDARPARRQGPLSPA